MLLQIIMLVVSQIYNNLCNENTIFLMFAFVLFPT